ASYNLGAAYFTLSQYFQNFQTELEYNQEFKQKIVRAFSDAIWIATGEITNYSQHQAKANSDHFIAGKNNEEKEFQNSMIKNTLLSPLKKVENNNFVKGIMSKFGK